MRKHNPVLEDKVLEVLSPKKSEKFADFTAGYGGHSELLLQSVGAGGFGYLFDQDETACNYLREHFRAKNVQIKKVNFSKIDWQNDLPKVDIMLLDLGVSSPQLDDASRGFSFREDAALDMRMNQENEISAAEIVNTYSAQELANIIFQYGEERRSRVIAKAIVEHRAEQTISTTLQLAEIITGVVPRSGRIHPATKTFQALRIAVNDELGALKMTLPKLPLGLSQGGRIAIISFHSLEDRMVKQYFKSLCTPVRDQFGQTISEPQFRAVTKKPIKGSQFDISNPRARSAMLRAVEKIQ